MPLAPGIGCAGLLYWDERQLQPLEDNSDDEDDDEDEGSDDDDYESQSSTPHDDGVLDPTAAPVSPSGSALPPLTTSTQEDASTYQNFEERLQEYG